MTLLQLFLILVVIIIYSFIFCSMEDRDETKKINEIFAFIGVIAFILLCPLLIAMIFYYIKV